jgi:lipopolysaccharide transport system permease protein
MNLSHLNPKSHIQAFIEIIELLTRHRQLTWEMTKREISDRYTGQIFGILWSVGHPVILMCIYVFIFTYVFNIRIGGSRELPLDYTTYLLSGLIPWMSFQESMSKSNNVIISNANLVKQIVFPIEILAVKVVIACLITQVVSTVFLIVYTLLVFKSLHTTYFLLPFLLLLQTMAMIGVSYIFSSVGVFFRDLKDFVQIFCLAGVYLMPIFYLPDQVPRAFRPLLYLNPFTYMGWCYQDVCYFGRFEHPWSWVIFVFLSFVSFGLGYRVFRKMKTMFGNVL